MAVIDWLSSYLLVLSLDLHGSSKGPFLLVSVVFQLLLACYCSLDSYYFPCVSARLL